MTQNIIGERIAGLLMEQGKTQRELAKQVGTTAASISRYIKGDRIPKGTILANIAKALQTTTDYLLGNEKDSNDPELEYNYTQRAIALNANRWSKKQKLYLVNALFENEGGFKMTTKEFVDSKTLEIHHDDEETIKDVFDTLTDKQKKAVAIIVSQVTCDMFFKKR